MVVWQLYLLNTDASSIVKGTDEIVVGAKYENILGNIGEAIGATTTTITGPNGEDVEVHAAIKWTICVCLCKLPSC